MEELFLKALLWIDNIEPLDGYVNLLHEIFMRPENEENQYLLDLEDCTNNKKDTHHAILSFVNSDQTSWDEELFIKLFMEYIRSRYEENESVHETMRIAYNLLRNLPVSSVRKIHKPLSTLDLAETYLGSDYPSQYSAYKAFFDSVYYYADESEKEAAFNKALEEERVERIEEPERTQFSRQNAKPSEQDGVGIPEMPEWNRFVRRVIEKEEQESRIERSETIKASIILALWILLMCLLFSGITWLAVDMVISIPVCAVLLAVLISVWLLGGHMISREMPKSDPLTNTLNRNRRKAYTSEIYRRKKGKDIFEVCCNEVRTEYVPSERIMSEIEKRGYEFSDVNDDFMKALYFGINQGFIAVGKKYFVIFTGRICRITLISSIRQVVHFSELLYKDMISSNRMELERHYLRIEEFDGSNCIVLCFNSVAADFAIERFNEIGIFTSTIPTKRIPSSQSTRVS